MKVRRALLAAVLLAAGVGLGRWSAPRPQHADAATLASFREALDERDGLARAYRISAYLQQLGPGELPEALEALERRRAWLGQDELRLFMLAWARFDAPAAFERALSWPGRSQRTAAGAAIYAWATRDPDAALRALDALEDAQLRDFLRTRLVAGWTRGEERERANRYIASLPEGPQRESFAGMLARELNEEGPDAVMRWADGVPELVPSYKRTVFRKACAALASTDPEAALRWAATHAGRSYAAGAEGIIAGRWADDDPEAALAWLLGLSPSPERDAAIADAFGRWLAFARAPAERWLSSATPSAELDAAVRVVVRQANREGSPEGALAWAKRIEETKLRDEVLVAVARAWMRREPEAARSWLAKSELPEALRVAIREPGTAQRASGDAARGTR